MRKTKQKPLDFVIDKLTNSIENVLTGDSFRTDVTLVSGADLKTIIKKNGWVFDWKDELKPQLNKNNSYSMCSIYLDHFSLVFFHVYTGKSY